MKTDINQLLSVLKKNNLQVAPSTTKQIQNLNKKAKKVAEPQSQIKQQKKLRKINYDNVKQDMDKWVPILKINRQKDHLNFTQKTNNQIRVNFFPSNKDNQITKQINQELKNINLGSQKQLNQKQSKTLSKLNTQDAQQRLKKVRNDRNAMFYQQIKRKRISKIKSKLYHRIKKRQKVKAELQNLNNMDPQQKQLQLEKLREKRGLQRINLRHKTKNKYIQDLMRFGKGQKNKIQQSINQLTRIRKQQLQKLNEEVAEDVSQQYDQQNFRQQALNDLKNEIKLIQNAEQNKSNLTGLKFMDNALNSKLQNDKSQAYNLMEKIINNEQIQVSQQQIDEQQSDEQKSKLKKKRKRNKQQQKQLKIFQNISRKKYEKQQKNGKKQKVQNEKNIKKFDKDINENFTKTLSEYIDKNTTNKSQINQENLVKDININKLKQKYQPKRIDPINMKQFVEENQQLFQNIAIEQNRQQFQKQKNLQYQQLIQPKQKKIKGWGTWTGPGIAEKKPDIHKQLKQKIQKIQQLKKMRKDGNIKNVIINEKRNKQFSQYLVQDLPYNYKSKEQFEFINSAPIGQQWNSIHNFKQIIKPKIITKVGQVINPISLPKKIAKIHE